MSTSTITSSFDHKLMNSYATHDIGDRSPHEKTYCTVLYRPHADIRYLQPCHRQVSIMTNTNTGIEERWTQTAAPQTLHLAKWPTRRPKTSRQMANTTPEHFWPSGHLGAHIRAHKWPSGQLELQNKATQSPFDQHEENTKVAK